CAASAKWKNLFLTGLFGWWGFPWGLFITPLYIGKNLYGLMFPTPSEQPSAELREHVRTNLMAHVLEQQQAEPSNQNE
ncbi:MAG: hypothetical protein LBH00_05850, partial [Planctomycetaceae bacterium]|nr:hypothetical protein [Planctomycetaceae bacterium]